MTFPPASAVLWAKCECFLCPGHDVRDELTWPVGPLTSSNSPHPQTRRRLAGCSVWASEKAGGVHGEGFLAWFKIAHLLSDLWILQGRHLKPSPNSFKYISSVVFICICCLLMDSKRFVDHPSVIVCFRSVCGISSL